MSDCTDKQVPDNELLLHPKEGYSKVKIDFKPGAFTAISTRKEELTTKGNETINYDKLIVTVGCECFVPPLPGHNLEGVFSIKYKRDADAVRAYAQGKKEAVVICGGVLGLEAADSLEKLGLEVTVLEFVPRVM